MCIRDRVDGAAGDPQAQQRAEHAQRHGEHDHQRMQEAFEPVSYTHLRAHETVLDIVCRLLLEKKKTIKMARRPQIQQRTTDYMS
mgnify:CR=1 FL=1